MLQGITRRRGVFAVLGLAAASALLVGCAAQQRTAAGGAPPKLHIGAGAAARDGVGVAGATELTLAGGPQGGLGVLAGYVLAGSLPDTPTRAPVWRSSPAKAGGDDIGRLAGALGLSGTPQRHAHGWVVAAPTGELRLRDTGEWSYVRADLLNCPPYSLDVDGFGGSVGCASAVAVAPGDVPATPPPGPDDGATRAAATGLLRSLGVSGVEHVSVSASFSTLTVAPTVGSLPTQGVETRVDVDASGIRSAAGRLGSRVKGPDYPLQTAKAAFDQLGAGPRPMMAPYCGPDPRGAAERLATSDTAAPGVPAGSPNSVARTAPAAPAAGAAAPNTLPAPPDVPMPEPQPCPTPEPLNVTGATLGLTAMWDGTADGPDILVPAWFFSVKESPYPLTVVAVDPSFIDDRPPPAGGIDVGGGSTGVGAGVSGAAPPVESSPTR